MKRFRYRDEDPELREMQANFERAAATLWCAIGLAVAWAAVQLIGFGGVIMASPLAVIPRLFATVFGWGAVTLAAIAAVRYVYAFLYLRFLGWRG